MKSFVPLALVIIFLSGCPNSKVPKAPPGVPEPKASLNLLMSAAAPVAISAIFL